MTTRFGQYVKSQFVTVAAQKDGPLPSEADSSRHLPHRYPFNIDVSEHLSLGLCAFRTDRHSWATPIHYGRLIQLACHSDSVAFAHVHQTMGESTDRDKSATPQFSLQKGAISRALN
jgi:hypothetical protein